ncbi:MAG TPA: hypothetical protein VGI19_01045 [Candidatus Cybelea sp.]|jgi:hypothetical protein
MLVAGFAGCSRSPTAGGEFIPTAARPGAGVIQPNSGIRIFTANRDGRGVLAFSGNAHPIRTIRGSKTALNGANYLALH